MTTAPYTAPACAVVRPGETYDGKQVLAYVADISTETVGAIGICMHLLTIPPGGRANADLHWAHETAISIPAGVPHLPYNPRAEPVVAVLARTDPNEQESVLLCSDPEAAVPC